jgi:hypothetical protein
MYYARLGQKASPWRKFLYAQHFYPGNSLARNSATKYAILQSNHRLHSCNVNSGTPWAASLIAISGNFVLPKNQKCNPASVIFKRENKKDQIFI